MAYVDFADGLVLAGKSYKKFPLILSNTHVVNRLTLKYFLSQRILWSKGTFQTYIKHICDFISQLEVENEAGTFDHIDDYWLEAYAEEILRRNENSENYVAQLLSSVIRFLVWCEEHNYCKNLIGLTPEFRIRVIQTNNGFTSNLIKYYQKRESAPKIAPRHAWIDAVKGEQHFKSKELETRFSLMVDWGKLSGLRAHEICALSINQLPSRETIEKNLIDKQLSYIELTETKGMKKAKIPVCGILLINTWNYIQSERHQVIKRISNVKRLHREAYIPPHQIFISYTTGNALHPRTLSNQFRQGWLQAVKNNHLTKNQQVWLHGLRHRYATDKLLKLSQAKNVHDPIEVTKTLTRHSRSSTLDIYTASIGLEDVYD